MVAPRDLRWLLLGTLLPDLVDKPLYYALVLATGRHGAELGLLSSSRTVGHTLLFALALRLVFGRGPGGALAAGACTHLFLDVLSDLASQAFVALGWSDPGPPALGPSTLAAVFFPLLGPHFPIQPFKDLGEHLVASVRAWTLGSELLGGLLLWWRWRARRAEVTRGAAPRSGARP